MQKGLIEEIIENYDLIDKEMGKVIKPNTSSADMTRGFEVSKLACRQQEDVEMSPIMKNMLERFGDLKHGERLKVNAPITKAEKWLNETCQKLLNKYNGQGKSKKYNFSLPIDSKQFYDVDCWDNLKENMRDIQPGQEKERLAVSRLYSEPTKEFNLRRKLKTDLVLQKAVELVCQTLPSVRATHEFKEINLPFMNKHTNVSYPYWKNDRTQVSKDIRRIFRLEENTTYAQLTLKQAEQLPLDDIYKYNISTAYGRNQRGKGRFLVAISRIPNLILNQLESVEISTYKTKCSLFAGYNDAPYLKKVLTYFVEECNRRGYKCANWDQKRYDQHVNIEWIKLLGAISMLKANGDRSKQLALKRACLMTKTWLVNGMTGKLEEIHGRIFSGFIDTNRGGGIINSIITLYCLMKQDPEYADIAYSSQWFMLVMGDDNLFMYNPDHFDYDKYVKDMSLLGFEVHPDKQQFGAFFLQNRVYKDENNQLVMVYPWTRVLRSALFKETGKGLGPYGWVRAEAQQLYKLIESPIFFKIVLNILCEFDDYKLGYGKSVQYINDQIKKEDALALSENKRAKSTAEMLYDGDPTKENQFTDNGRKQASEYLSQIQHAIDSYYDPNFLTANGIKVPHKRK
nr:MAG: putative RNA-dependent RNA polymerase [Picobirnaviridae sp.]